MKKNDDDGESLQKEEEEEEEEEEANEDLMKITMIMINKPHTYKHKLKS